MNKTTQLVLAAIAGFGLCAQARTSTNELWGVDFDHEDVTIPEAGSIPLSSVPSSAFADGAWTVQEDDESYVTNGVGRSDSLSNLLELNTQGNDLTWTPTSTGDVGNRSIVETDILFVGADDAPEGFDAGTAQTAFYLQNLYGEEPDEPTGYQLYAWAWDTTPGANSNHWEAIGSPFGSTFADSWHKIQIVIDYRDADPYLHVAVDGTEVTGDGVVAANKTGTKSTGKVTAVSFKGTGAIDNFAGTRLNTYYESYDFTAQIYLDGDPDSTIAGASELEAADVGVADADFPDFKASFAALPLADYVIDEDLNVKVTYALSSIMVTNYVTGAEATYNFAYNPADYSVTPVGTPCPAFTDNADTTFTLTPTTLGATEDSLIAKVYYRTLDAYYANEVITVGETTVTNPTFVKPADCPKNFTNVYPAATNVNETSYVLSTVQVRGGATVAFANDQATVSFSVADKLAADTTYVEATYVAGTYNADAVDWTFDDTTGIGSFTAKTFTVAFTWHGGSSSATYAYGDPLAAPSVDATYTEGGATYTFTGWSPAVPATVTAAGTYVAQYEMTSAPKATVIVITDNGATTNTVGTYGSLADAVEAAPAGATVVLNDNIALASTVVVDKNLTIDLNGNDIAATDVRALWVKSGDVALAGEGTVSANGAGLGETSSVIRVGDSAANTAAAKLTIGADVTVASAKSYGVTVFGKNSDGDASTTDIALDVYGTVAVTSTGEADAAISGNGSSGLSAVDVTIRDGAVVSATNQTGIYFPGAGTLSIEGGSITAPTAVYAKAGTVEVSGGTLTATGAKADYQYYGNGPKATGDALVLDNCGYPNGTTFAASITGGTFVSANAQSVASYAYGTDATTQEAREPLADFIPATVGGQPNPARFSDAKSDGVPVGYELVAVEGTDPVLYEVSALAPIQWLNTWTANSIYYFDDEDPIPARSTQATVPKYKRAGASSYVAVVPGDGITVTWTVTTTAATTNVADGVTCASVDGSGLVTFTEPGSVKLWVQLTDPAGSFRVQSKTVKYAPAPAYTVSADGQTKTAYASLYAAFNHAQTGETIVLGADATVGNIGKMELKDGRSITLDLNGHTVTFNANYGTNVGSLFNIKSGSLSVVDSGATKGGIAATGTGGRVFSMETAANATTALSIGEGVNVSSAHEVCVYLEGAATLTTAGNLTAADDFAIAGNGTAGKGGTTVNVTGGTVTGGEVAIYQPQNGTLNISGGTITGDTAVYVKSGTVSVTGGTLAGTGTAADYTYNGNGANATGDALVIENCGYPGGTPVVSITGGTFTSANAQSVSSYAYGTDSTTQEDREPLDDFIPATVGDQPNPARFSDAEADGVPEGYGLKETEPGSGVYAITKTYVVTYANYDGAALQVTTNFVGDATPAYAGETPVKRSDSQYDYTFTGWSPEAAATVTEDATYTAQFSATKNGTVIVITDNGATTNYFATLPLAFAAAVDGDTVALLANQNLDERVFVNAGATPVYAGTNNRYATTSDNRSLTLDLNGHSITNSSNIALAGGSLNITGSGEIATTASGLAPVEVRGTGDLASKRTLTVGPDVTLAGGEYGLNVFGSNDAQKNVIDVTVNGSVKGTLFVLGNLKNAENEINIVVNGSVIAPAGVGDDVVVGIALNGNANVTVNDGAVVSGDSGIEVRAGNLTVNGGTITATADSYSYKANGSGSTTKGAAISVAQHTTALSMTATLNGGTLVGVEEVYVKDVNNNNLSNVGVVATASFAEDATVPEGFAWIDNGEGDYVLTKVWVVTYANYDGTVLQVTTNVTGVATPAYAGETPVKPSAGGYDYTFTGWDPAVASTVTADATYTAQFAEKATDEHVGAKSEEGFVILAPTDGDYDSAKPLTFAAPDLTAGKVAISASMICPENVTEVTLTLLYKTDLTAAEYSKAQVTVGAINAEAGTATVTLPANLGDTVFFFGFDNELGVTDTNAGN